MPRRDDYDRPRKKKPNTGLILGLVVGGAALLGLVVVGGCVVVFLSAKKSVDEQQVKREAADAQLPTRDEFRAKWEGKTADEFVAAFGKPAFTSEYGDHTSWSYSRLNSDKRLARDPVTGKVVDVWLDVDKTGRIVRIRF